MPRSDLDAVPTFPLRLLHIPKPAKLIGFVLQRPFAFRFLPYDVAQAVTMSVFYIYCISSSALSVGDISHAPVQASLPRDRVLLFFFSLRGFLSRCCPHCLSELSGAIACYITSPPVWFCFVLVLCKSLRPTIPNGLPMIRVHGIRNPPLFICVTPTEHLRFFDSVHP